MSPLMGPDAAAYAWPDRRVRCRVTFGAFGRPVPNASRFVYLEVVTYLTVSALRENRDSVSGGDQPAMIKLWIRYGSTRQ